MENKTNEGEVEYIEVPQNVGEPRVEVVPISTEKTKEDNGDDLSDLFTVEREDTADLVEITNEDIMGDDDADMSDDALALPGEEDMEDLFEVTESDVMGDDISPPKQARKYKRTTRRYMQPPPANMGGIRY